MTVLRIDKWQSQLEVSGTTSEYIKFTTFIKDATFTMLYVNFPLISNKHSIICLHKL